MSKKMACYIRREKSLMSLGFRTYREYLASPLWRTIRLEILKRDKFRCRCGDRATQVHHTSYSFYVMRGDRPGRLISVCDKCHVNAEFNSGKKVKVSVANGRLRSQHYAKQVTLDKLEDPERIIGKGMRRRLRLMNCQWRDKPTYAEALVRLKVAVDRLPASELAASARKSPSKRS
jgi:hypothetical protein